MRLLLLLAALLATSPLLSTPAQAATMEVEARRQLEFAQAELDKGDFDKAIKSAQSAYRLDPTAHRALILIGLGYEGLGELEKARSFLETCTTLASGTGAAIEAAEALERVQAAIEDARNPRKKKAKAKKPAAKASASKETPVEETPITDPPLTVRGVPTNSTVRLFLESANGAAVERTVTTPAGIGTLDPSTGVLLAEPVTFADILPGSGGLFVQHPVLGEGAVEVTVQAGRPTVVDFEVTTMPGLQAVRTQYEFWRAEAAGAATTVDPALGVATGVSVGLGAVAGVLLGVSFAEEADLPGKHEVYRAQLQAGGDIDAAWTEWNEGRIRVEGLRGAAAALGGGAVIGAGITIIAGSLNTHKAEPWTPDGF